MHSQYWCPDLSLEASLLAWKTSIKFSSLNSPDTICDCEVDQVCNLHHVASVVDIDVLVPEEYSDCQEKEDYAD